LTGGISRVPVARQPSIRVDSGSILGRFWGSILARFWGWSVSRISVTLPRKYGLGRKNTTCGPVSGQRPQGYFRSWWKTKLLRTSVTRILPGPYSSLHLEVAEEFNGADPIHRDHDLPCFNVDGQVITDQRAMRAGVVPTGSALCEKLISQVPDRKIMAFCRQRDPRLQLRLCRLHRWPPRPLAGGAGF
jgi:hypothetical protein